MLARLNMAPFTWTGTMRMLEPIGIDGWPYSWRSVWNARWPKVPRRRAVVVGYRSRNMLSESVTPPDQSNPLHGASFAAIRLWYLTPFDKPVCEHDGG